MLIVDLTAGALIAGLAVRGALAGVCGTLALAGFAAGAAAGAALAQVALDRGLRDEFALAVGLPAALVAGGLVAAAIERLGNRRRARVDRQGPAGAIGGALLGGWVGSSSFGSPAR
ncbi:MAG: hypothetical protein WKF94_12125 [Solirubrobacteraceae bacterium]